MIFLVPFLSSAGEMFVVCPKDQLQSGVGRSIQEVPSLSWVSCYPKGSRFQLPFAANPICGCTGSRDCEWIDSVTQHNHPSIEDVAPGKRTWVAEAKLLSISLLGGEGMPLASASAWPQVPHISSTQQETFTPCMGAFFTLVVWSCFLIYLYFNFYEMEIVLPT